MEKLVRQRDFEREPNRIRQARPEELPRLLGRKLVEEAEEVLAVCMLHPSVITDAARKVQLIDELADVVEAMFAVATKHLIAPPQIINRATLKAERRGHLIDRVLIDATDDRVETKLRTLVEDLVAALRDARLGEYGHEDRADNTAKLEQRARDLGCIGEVA